MSRFDKKKDKKPNNKPKVNKVKKVRKPVNKKLVWIYSLIFVLVFGVTAGLTACVIPDNSDPQPSTSAKYKNQIPNDQAHNIKQRFMATNALGAMMGMQINDISADIYIETPTKVEDGTLTKVQQHLKVDKAHGEMRFPMGMPIEDPGPIRENYFKFSVPIKYEDEHVVTFDASLYEEVVYLNVNDKKGGKDIDFKYKISMEQIPELDEEGRKTLIRIYPLYWKSISELDKVLRGVGKLVAQFKKDAGIVDDGKNDDKQINYQALLDGIWDCTCISNGPNKGYSFYPVIPFGYVGEKPILTIYCSATCNKDYELTEFALPSYVPGSENEAEVKKIADKEHFSIPFLEDIVPTKMKLCIKDLTFNNISKEHCDKNAPKNPKSYVSVLDSLEIFEKLRPVLKQPKIGFGFSGKLEHKIGTDKVTKKEITETAEFSIKGGCDFGPLSKFATNIRQLPEFAYFGGELSAIDEHNQKVTQSFKMNYQDEKTFINYSDQLKLRMDKEVFDTMYHQFKTEFLTKLKPTFNINLEKLNESVKAISGLGITRTISSLLEEFNSISKTDTWKSLSGGTFEKLVPFIKGISAKKDVIKIEITLDPIGLKGDIAVQISKNNFFTMSIKNLEFGDFTITDTNFSTEVYKPEDLLPDLIPECDYVDYYNLKEASGVFSQLGNLFVNKQALVDADIVYQNFDKDDGPRLHLDASGSFDFSDTNVHIATGSAVLKQFAIMNGKMEQANFNIGMDMIDTFSNGGTRDDDKSNVFMKFNSYHVGEDGKPIKDSNYDALQGYVGINTILDTLGLFRCAGSQDDPRITRIVQLASALGTNAYLGSVINENKLNGLITTLPLLGVQVGEIPTAGTDADPSDTMLCLTVNKDVLGSNKNVRFDILIGDEGIKTIDTSYRILSPEASNKEDKELKMKLDFSRPYEGNEVEKNWKVNTKDTGPVAGKHSDSKVGIDKFDEIYDCHDKSQLLNMNKLAPLFEYTVNSALYGSGTFIEKSKEGGYVTSNDKIDDSTYHLQLKVPSLKIGNDISVDKLVPNLNFDAYVKLSGAKLYIYSKLRIPVIPVLSNPDFGVGHGVSLFHSYIETEMLYVNEGTNLDVGNFLDSGTFYFSRKAQYDENSFKDYRKVSGKNFFAHLGEWLDQYILNDYMNHDEVYSDLGVHHRSYTNNLAILPFFIDDFLDHNSFEYIDDPKAPAWECAVNLSKIFPSVYEDTLKEYANKDRVSFKIVAAPEAHVFKTMDFKFTSHLVTKIEAEASLSLVNIDENDEYINCWGDIEGRFDQLRKWLDGNIKEYERPFGSNNTHDIERDGKSEGLDGNVIEIIDK